MMIKQPTWTLLWYLMILKAVQKSQQPDEDTTPLHPQNCDTEFSSKQRVTMMVRQDHIWRKVPRQISAHLEIR